MNHPRDGKVHNTTIITPVVEHWLEQEIGQWVKEKEVMKMMMIQITATHL